METPNLQQARRQLRDAKHLHGQAATAYDDARGAVCDYARVQLRSSLRRLVTLLDSYPTDMPLADHLAACEAALEHVGALEAIESAAVDRLLQAGDDVQACYQQVRELTDADRADTAA